MRKPQFLPITFILLLLPLLSRGFNILPGKVIKEWQVAHTGPQIKTIVIDAGHGGHDPGCLGSSSQEKHIALSIAQKLAASIRRQHPDIKVILTRDKDVFIPLHERAAIANRNNADLFISIHCNYMPGSSATHGTETYVMGLHTAEYNLQVAKRENAAILLEENYAQHYDYDPNSPEGHIMLTMFQSAFLEQSILFAEAVEERLAQHAQRRSRGVKQAGFVVLKATSMPSVLIETGFLSNIREEQFLSTEAGQLQVAEGIALAFNHYRNHMEQDILLAKTDAAPPAPSSVPVNPAPAQAATPAPEKSPPAPKATPPTYAQGNSSYSSVPPKPVPTPQPVAPPPVQASPQPVYNTGNAAPAKPAATLIFVVQLAASNQAPPQNDQRWKNLPFTIEVAREENLYKYRTRTFNTFTEADAAKNQLRQLGYPDAFVLAFENGKRISLEEAIKR